MKTYPKPRPAVLLVLLVLAATPAAWAQQPSPPPSERPSPERSSSERRPAGHLHPALVLRDASGAAVLRTGQPLSLQETCGTCHDTDYIVRHATHEAPDVAENCLLCHTPAPNDAARRQALAGGLTAWASTATLAGTGVVEALPEGWRWNAAAFEGDGRLRPGVLAIQDPSDANCAQCHGPAHTDPPSPAAGDMTALTGQRFAPGRLSESTANLAGRDRLARTWDVHAERLVACVDCHHASNSPAHLRAPAAARPAHLAFDPRRQDLEAYLQRPSHALARSEAAADAVTGRCTSCHEAEAAHGWLPYADRHLAAVACETCHIPHAYAAAQRSVDRTVPGPDGAPVVAWRGVEGDPASASTLVTGFAPVLLSRREADGRTRLAPYNLVTTWSWVSGDDARPVSPADLLAALWPGGRPAGTLLAALDRDGDGRLADAERVLDTPEKVAALRALLEAAGIAAPHVRGEVQPYGMHHGVTRGDWAVRTCRTCHDDASRLAAPVVLAAARPAGAVPVFQPEPGLVLDGRVATDAQGRLVYRPEARGVYVLGHDAVAWVDRLGLVLVLLVLAGAAVHGGLRVVAARRGVRPHPRGPVRRVYLYSTYERFWHWLQATAIVGLLGTGLVVHLPGVFDAVDFGWAVRVHNLLGFILLANALLAAFYHFASGEVRQFLPRPQGFFSEAIEQLVYYGYGIFRGAPHPFERNPEKKLNPLQKLTYLAILNVLLPLQFVTGLLIWGAQRWSHYAAMMGGLGFLAPFHTLVAWLFAAFLLMHLYLTTTGHTPTAHLKAMVDGWDEVPVAFAGDGATADSTPSVSGTTPSDTPSDTPSQSNPESSACAS